MGRKTNMVRHYLGSRSRGQSMRQNLRRQTSRGRRQAERRVWQGIKAGRWDYDSAPWPARQRETVNLWSFY